MVVKIDYNYLIKWKEKIQKAITSQNITPEVIILYYKNAKKQISDLCYTKFDTENETISTIYERFQQQFTETKVKNKEIKKFNLIEKNVHTIYYCPKSRFQNLSNGIKNIKSSPVKANFTKDNLNNSVCMAVKLTYEKTTDIIFFGINSFNSLKKGLGFFGNIKSKDGSNQISKIDDNHLLFGISPSIDVVYIEKDNNFLILPNGKTMFEKTFLLESEYKKVAKKVAKNLKNYKKQLLHIDQLERDYYGNSKTSSSSMLDRMLAKLSSKEYEKKLDKLMKDPKKWKNRLKQIEDFKKDDNFNKKFEKLKIDLKNGQLQYSKKCVFPFLQVLSDRPKKSILLELNELGS
ncbi:hypothetical protein [Lactobacillus helsingborgensis]|uniref:hypothetical protein n=1 Tax=Lactobacillus helsingborgensis TaxID=1218494 RepID=UPI001CC6712C|nr:hypothetical protein [Lactobacillus helsingborgensis]